MKELLWLSHVDAGGEDGHVLKDFNLTIFCGEMLCLYAAGSAENARGV